MSNVRESSRHLEAFEYYYILGDNRSYAKVAEKYNVNIGTVTRWAGKYSWQRRVVERDHKIALQLQRETDKEILEDKKMYRKLIKASLQSYMDNLKNNKIKVNNVKDFYTLARLDMMFMETLDKGTANDIGDLINVSNESLDTINRLNDELAGVVEPPDLEEDEDA